MTADLPTSVAQVVGTPVGAGAATVPVLVVNDTAAQRLALRSVLAPLGYRVVEADSGLEALRCLMLEDFAVILLDVCMPGMDGFETAGLIRQRQQSEMTPLIFITAYGSDEIQTDLYAEGAVDFIFAPVPPDELRAKVSVFANLYLRAKELARRAAEVQASADEFWLLTDAAPIGIFQTDPLNRYVYTNPRWSDITGIPPAEALGQVWGSMNSPRNPEGDLVELADTTAAGAELSHRVEITVTGSKPRTVVVTSRSIPDGDGGIAGWVGTLADISAEVDAEAAMSEARDKATEASRLKSDFLANMSHEIRTPMNGVLGMTDLLLETELDVRQRDYAQTVRNSGEALLTIVNDILDFSKVEAGKLEVEAVDFDPRRIVNDVVDLLAGPAQAKGLELIAVVDRAVPSLVRGDPGRVRQVLTNVIGNAIKFTQAGEVVVRVDEPEGIGTDRVIRFEVADTGDGIAPDKLAAVFQPFVQADTSTSRRYGGTGLGLAICSQLVSLMGGDCGVTSELGTGSAFWFTISASAFAESNPSMPDVYARDQDLVGVKALVVDDSATVRNVLAEYLTEWGMDATAIGSGESALAAMRQAEIEASPFAVVLLDRRMPGIDGLAVKSAIVADPDLNARVVLMVGLGEERDLGPVAESGVCASVSKPVHVDELRDAVRVALGLQNPEVAKVAVEATTPADPIIPRGGRILLAEDNLINQKVAIAILSTAGYEVDTVQNGAEAVAAAAAGTYDAILMDCQMPEMSGYEASVIIRAAERADGAHRHIPIIAMTAGARREDRERCLAEGMDSYLAKPVSKDALLALLLRSIETVSARPTDLPSTRAARDRDPSRSPDDLIIDTVIFDELRVLGQAANQDLVAEVSAQFIHDTEPLLVALSAAVTADDAFTVSRIVHQIIGGCGQLGGRRLAAACRRLETMADTGALSDATTAVDEIEIDYQDLRDELLLQTTTGVPS